MTSPYFIIYSGDLSKHIGYRRASRYAKGVYLDLLLLMNEGSDRGVLIFNDVILTKAEIAGLLVGDQDGAVSAIEELVRCGLVAVRKDGALFAPDLVAQEIERQKAANRKRAQRKRDTDGFIPNDGGGGGGDGDGKRDIGVTSQKVTKKSRTKSQGISSSLSLNKEFTDVNSSSAVVRLDEHKAKKSKSEERKSFYEYFYQRFEECYDEPYEGLKKDFIQFSTLERTHSKHNKQITLERWKQAVGNYFASERGKHGMADLCANFSFFFKSPLDRFNQPLKAKQTAQTIVVGGRFSSQVNAANSSEGEFEAACLEEYERHKRGQFAANENVIEAEVVA